VAARRKLLRDLQQSLAAHTFAMTQRYWINTRELAEKPQRPRHQDDTLTGFTVKGTLHGCQVGRDHR
jgi:hypothetical protein